MVRKPSECGKGYVLDEVSHLQDKGRGGTSGCGHEGILMTYQIQCNVCRSHGMVIGKSRSALLAWYVPHMRYTHGLDVHENLSLHPRPEFESKVK